MPSLNALSLAPDVNNWLENSHSPRILHVFDQACNLINERRDVLSVVTPPIGNGPFNLVIPGLRKSLETSEVFFNHLNVEVPVSIHKDWLILGDLTINTANTKLWDPRPEWELLHVQREHVFSQLKHLPTLAPGREASAGVTNYQSSLPASLLSTFSISIAAGDLPDSITAARQLAGLGAGLTPAGDDFMMGAMYAVWIIHPPDIASVLAQQIADTAAPLTTSLSAAWLRSAGKGEASILWHEFFDALISVRRIVAQHPERANPTNRMALEESMERILVVGETSGSDAMEGFMGVFKCWSDPQSNLWEYNQT